MAWKIPGSEDIDHWGEQIDGPQKSSGPLPTQLRPREGGDWPRATPAHSRAV